jgi:hypothetical protein
VQFDAASARPSELGDKAVHEAPAQIESTVSNPKNVMSGHHDGSTSRPFQNMQQIVAEAGLCTSATVQLGVNGNRDECGVHIGRETVIRVIVIVLNRAHRTRGTTRGKAPLRHAVRLPQCGGGRRSGQRTEGIAEAE